MMSEDLTKKERLAILQHQKAKSSQFMKETRELREKNEKHREEHKKQNKIILDYIRNKDIDSKYKAMLRDAFGNDEIKSISDVDKYIKDNKLLKSNNKNDIDDIKKLISMSPKIKKKAKTSNVSRAMNLIEDVINAPKKKVYKDDMNDVKSIIKEVEKLSKKKPSELKKLVKADKVHLKYHPSEQDKKEAKIDEASLLLSPYKYNNLSLVDQIAHSMKTPEFDSIVKKKVKLYSYDIVNKFNKKYPELMLRLFKTDKAVDKLLLKKSNNIEKKKVSEEKSTARKKKYSEKAKEIRKENKNKKYKHLDDMTDAELKKFNQARNYYMRKSKDSTILPKGLNKSDPEGLNNVCKELAVNGFDTMSEHLFMKIYEG